MTVPANDRWLRTGQQLDEWEMSKKSTTPSILMSASHWKDPEDRAEIKPEISKKSTAPSLLTSPRIPQDMLNRTTTESRRQEKVSSTNGINERQEKVSGTNGINISLSHCAASSFLSWLLGFRHKGVGFWSSFFDTRFVSVWPMWIDE